MLADQRQECIIPALVSSGLLRELFFGIMTFALGLQLIGDPTPQYTTSFPCSRTGPVTTSPKTLDLDAHWVQHRSDICNRPPAPDLRSALCFQDGMLHLRWDAKLATILISGFKHRNHRCRVGEGLLCTALSH